MTETDTSGEQDVESSTNTGAAGGETFENALMGVWGIQLFALLMSPYVPLLESVRVYLFGGYAAATLILFIAANTVLPEEEESWQLPRPFHDTVVIGSLVWVFAPVAAAIPHVPTDATLQFSALLGFAVCAPVVTYMILRDPSGTAEEVPDDPMEMLDDEP